MTPCLSVVLPVRNAEGTLARAVQSCLSQTLGDFELLIVLNGCEDRSQEIAEHFSQKDERVKVRESAEEGGVAEAMRLGVESSSSEFIARMDADDVSYPSRFEKQWSFLSGNRETGVVSCGVRLENAMGEGMQRYVDWVNGLITPESVARERFIECPVIQPSLLMRRSVIERAGGYRENDWAEDHDLFLRMLELGILFGKVPETLLDWSDHESRLTRTHPAYAEDQVWRMKAHFLARVPGMRERGAVLCGAGPIGKRLARLLRGEGVTVHGFFEVNPRKVGSEISGVPVAGAEEFALRWREAVLLSAVGVSGGRERVRALANSAGYQEGRDFWVCC